MNSDFYKLFLDDMVANAFVEINSRNKEKITEIPLIIIEQYGNEVAEKLERDGNRIAFCFSREATEEFRVRYKGLFT